MKITALVEALVAANATPEMILAAVRTVEAQNSDALEQSREKARARFKKWKAKQPANVSQRLPTDNNALVTGDAPVEDKPLNQKIEPQKEEKKETRERASFDAFWDVYPHKVGKADARNKFTVASRKIPLETLMSALHRYVAKTDDRPWCNPATWLHQERWTDQPATVAPMARGSPSKVHLTTFIQDAVRARNDRSTDQDPGSPVLNFPAIVGSRNA